MPGRKELRQIRFKAETTNGTGVATRHLFRGNGDLIDDQRTIKRVDMQVGVFGGTDETYTPKLYAELALNSTEATFEQLPDLIQMCGIGTSGGGNRAGSAQGASGSTAVFLLAVPTTTVPITYSYTTEAGNGTLGATNDGWTERMTYTLCKDLKLSFKGGEAMMVSATLFGQNGTPTNTMGTYTLIGTLPTVETIVASKGSFWLSPVGSGFGSQAVTAGNILAGELSITPTWALKYPVDSGLLTFATAVFTGIEIKGNLTLEGQSSGTYGAYGSAAQVEKWRSEVPQLLTMTWRGGAITEGTTYTNKELTIQLPIKWNKFAKVGDIDGNDIRVGDFSSELNQTNLAASGRGTFIIARGNGTSEFAGA